MAGPSRDYNLDSHSRLDEDLNGQNSPKRVKKDIIDLTLTEQIALRAEGFIKGIKDEIKNGTASEGLKKEQRPVDEVAPLIQEKLRKQLEDEEIKKTKRRSKLQSLASVLQTATRRLRSHSQASPSSKLGLVDIRNDDILDLVTLTNRVVRSGNMPKSHGAVLKRLCFKERWNKNERNFPYSNRHPLLTELTAYDVVKF